MDEPKKNQKRLSRIRRIILLAAIGVLVGLLVVTGVGAVPRPVDIDIILSGSSIARPEVRTTITADDEVVADASERISSTGGSASLSYNFWLAPQPHRIEVVVIGCPNETRTFDPRETDELNIVVRCESELEPTGVQ